MVGTHSGALKAKQKILARDKDFYRKIGRIGGMAETSAPKGFACDIERARKAGSKGGKISKRGEAKYAEF